MEEDRQVAQPERSDAKRERSDALCDDMPASPMTNRASGLSAGPGAAESEDPAPQANLPESQMKKTKDEGITVHISENMQVCGESHGVSMPSLPTCHGHEFADLVADRLATRLEQLMRVDLAEAIQQNLSAKMSALLAEFTEKLAGSESNNLRVAKGKKKVLLESRKPRRISEERDEHDQDQWGCQEANKHQERRPSTLSVASSVASEAFMPQGSAVSSSLASNSSSFMGNLFPSSGSNHTPPTPTKVKPDEKNQALRVVPSNHDSEAAFGERVSMAVTVADMQTALANELLGELEAPSIECVPTYRRSIFANIRQAMKRARTQDADPIGMAYNNDVGRSASSSSMVSIAKDSSMTAMRASVAESIVRDLRVDNGRHNFTQECSSSSHGNHLWILPTFFLRMCGVLPWSSIRHRSSKTKWYRGMISMVACLAVATSLHALAQMQEKKTLCYSDACVRIGLLSDVPLALGSLLGFLSLAVNYGGADFSGCIQMLHVYARREDFEERWGSKTCRDLTVTLIIWLGAVLERFRGTGVAQAAFDGNLDAWTTLNIIAYAMSSLVLMSLVFSTLYVCQALMSTVDTFCIKTIAGNSLNGAVPKWNMVQAILRKGSASLQLCMSVLQATVVLTCLVAVVDVYQSRQRSNGVSYATMLVPNVVLTLGVSMVVFKAAVVTDKCARVPSLINSCTHGEDLDVERQYVVEYVLHSDAGFHVFDIRLTSGMTLKYAYICIVGVFALFTQMVGD